MELYRYGGELDEWTISYSLDSHMANRLDVGMVDWYALDKLSELVSGGISSISDLFAAELALRAIIFHEQIKEVRPSITIQIVNSSTNPFFLDDSPACSRREEILEVLKSAGHTASLCGIEQLIGFSDDVNVPEFLQRREQHRQQKLAIEKAKREIAASQGTRICGFDVETAPIEHVAANKDEFFEAIFAESHKYLRSYLSPLSGSGHAVYLGHPQTNFHYDQLRNYNASQFFDVLDKGWKAHHEKLRRRLQVPVPLFLSIVLSRSSSREKIPIEIGYLRQEFAEARRQLWDLFDEADFRIYDSTVAVRILDDIEKEAASIIPRSLDAREFGNPLRFDLLGRLLELEGLGILKDLASFLSGAAANQCIRVDAANLTQQGLQSVELTQLLERFLTEQEFRNVLNSCS